MAAAQRYYTKEEVAAHNTPEDCWVSFLGKVYNLTQLVANNDGPLASPITRHAGKDISDWFDPVTHDVKTHISPETNLLAYYAPHGRFIHVPPPLPCSDFDTTPQMPWWHDDEYHIGTLTTRSRKIRVVNTLSGQEDVVDVCEEETINEIVRRYLAINAHAESYAWKRLGKPLKMDQTLQENGVPDEVDDLEKHGLPDDTYLPALHVYFKDDLTIA